MCVIFFAYQNHPEYPLILAANRDEFYARPARPMQWWPGDPIAGGQDLQEGGAWIACDRTGRWAALTNFRDPAEFQRKARSRGHLVRDYLLSRTGPTEFISGLEASSHEYNGFNLLLGDQQNLHYFTNRPEAPRNRLRLEAGIYGLSNEFLDSPWPKVVSGKTALEDILETNASDAEAYYQLLHDETKAPVDQLPDTGLGKEKEYLLSSRFIRSPAYGTRAMTLIMQKLDGSWWMQEKLFGPDGLPRPEAEMPALQFNIQEQP